MRKSTSKNKNSYQLLDLQFRTNKHKKSVHEEVLNPQSSRKKGQRANTKKNSRISRNSLPVKVCRQVGSGQYSPRMQSPEQPRIKRSTDYQSQPRLVKKRLTEYQTEERSARMKVTNLGDLCRRLLEIEAESQKTTPPKHRHMPGKIVKNLPTEQKASHRSVSSVQELLTSECANDIKKSLASLVPRGSIQLSPSSNSGKSRGKPPIRRLKDSEYYRFG